MFGWTGHTTGPASAPNVTVIEPSVGLAKTVAPNTGDAGDAITYTLVLSNNGSVDAFDARLNDGLPNAGGPTLILAPSLSVADSAGLVTGANFSLTGSDAAGWVVATITPFDLLVSNRVITLTLTGTLPLYVVPGSSFTNTASATWTSLPGSPGTRSIYNTSATERTGADGPGGALDDYAQAAAARFDVRANQPTKLLVSTSEPHTTISNSLAIGEIVRFRLTVQIAEGTTPSLTVQDKLPAGLIYLNDGTSKAAFVANGLGITSSVISGAGLNFTGNDANVDAITPTFVLPAGAIWGGPFGSGTDPSFNLGDLVNSDSDLDHEFVVIEFNALAANGLSNQAGTVLTNTFGVLQSGVQSGADSNGVPVTIAEPVLTMTESLSDIQPVRPGDLVTFTLLVTNLASGPNAAAAFDLVLSDTLDSAFTGPFSLTLDTTGATPCGATPVTPSSGAAGQLVTFGLSCLNPGQHVTATVRATVALTAPAGSLIFNPALLTWTSLPLTGTPPGANNPTGSGTPGGSGAANGERDCSGGPGPDNVVLNNYAAPANVALELNAPAIVKLQPVPPDYTIGELVTFTLVITVPEGPSHAVVVTDSLPGGLGYLSHQIITSAAGSGGALGQNFGGSVTAAPVFTNTGGLLQFDLGDVNATVDNNPGNNAFVIRLVTQVQNILSNTAGTVLTNTAGLSFAQNGGTTTVGAPTPAVVTVVEPRLNIHKSVPAAPHTFYPGDVVTYTIVVDHRSDSQRTAFDMVITDVLPADLTNVSASASRSDGLDLSTELGGGLVRAPNTGDGTFVLPLGITATVFVTATVDITASAGDLVTNTAQAVWRSLPAPNGAERHSGDGLLGGGGLNDYEVFAGVFFRVGSPTVINLVSFTGTPQPDGSVRLDWQTGAEIDTAGFNLYRANSANGTYTRINPELIAARGNQGGGASYSFSDRPGTGTWYYKLEDVNTHNVSSRHGPITVNVNGTAGLPYKTYLPIVGR